MHLFRTLLQSTIGSGEGSTGSRRDRVSLGLYGNAGRIIGPRSQISRLYGARYCMEFVTIEMDVRSMLGIRRNRYKFVVATTSDHGSKLNDLQFIRIEIILKRPYLAVQYGGSNGR